MTGGIAEDVIGELKKKGKCPPGEKMVDGECRELMREIPPMKKKEYSDEGPMKKIPPGRPGKPKIKEL